MDIDPQSGNWLRLAIFIGLLVIFAGLEARFPRRRRVEPRSARWPANLAMVVLGSILIRLTLAGAAVGAALFAETQGIGIFNALGVPPIASFLITLLFLDFAIWAQHLVFHRVAIFWRIHSMHHVDLDLDVTTALRFHPVEYWISMVIKMALVVILGAPAAAVVVFEVILNGLALFNHANIALPLPLDRVLRRLIVTPDMHRIHHSVRAGEHNSNFGFNLSIWDRLFSTYCDQPAAGHIEMEIGLGVRGASATGLLPLLQHPIVYTPTGKEPDN